MFARAEGSVAAPTAGLHFTESLTEALRGAGIALHRVTLHVGPGTFLPVKADDTEGHRMHPEWGSVGGQTASALNAVRRAGGRIVAVGSPKFQSLIGREKTSVWNSRRASMEPAHTRPSCTCVRGVHAWPRTRQLPKIRQHVLQQPPVFYHFLTVRTLQR